MIFYIYGGFSFVLLLYFSRAARVLQNCLDTLTEDNVMTCVSRWTFFCYACGPRLVYLKCCFCDCLLLHVLFLFVMLFFLYVNLFSVRYLETNPRVQHFGPTDLCRNPLCSASHRAWVSTGIYIIIWYDIYIYIYAHNILLIPSPQCIVISNNPEVAWIKGTLLPLQVEWISPPACRAYGHPGCVN